MITLAVGLIMGTRLWYEAVERRRLCFRQIIPTDRAFADRLFSVEQVRYVGRGE